MQKQSFVVVWQVLNYGNVLKLDHKQKNQP